jgi:hypothetical protein
MVGVLLSVNDVLQQGILFLKKRIKTNISRDQKEEIFKTHYGSTPLALASMWYDMTTTNIAGAKLNEKEKLRGFKMFMAAHYFLWAYPKNAKLFASRFDLCLSYAQGNHLWKWVARVAALKDKVIKWDRRLDDPNAENLCITIDGTDKKLWEKKHSSLPIDKGRYTKKHAHGGVKYQVALAVHFSQCVAIFGPCRGGEHDKTMLERSELLSKLKPGKLAIVDRGYIKLANKHKLSWPNPYDSKEVNNFKSRARLRHEAFNGRLAFFNILSATFRQSEKKHKLAFEAVVVTVQYQMDNGSPLWKV